MGAEFAKKCDMGWVLRPFFCKTAHAEGQKYPKGEKEGGEGEVPCGRHGDLFRKGGIDGDDAPRKEAENGAVRPLRKAREELLHEIGRGDDAEGNAERGDKKDEDAFRGNSPRRNLREHAHEKIVVTEDEEHHGTRDAGDDEGAGGERTYPEEKKIVGRRKGQVADRGRGGQKGEERREGAGNEKRRDVAEVGLSLDFFEDGGYTPYREPDEEGDGGNGERFEPVADGKEHRAGAERGAEKNGKKGDKTAAEMFKKGGQIVHEPFIDAEKDGHRPTGKPRNDERNPDGGAAKNIFEKGFKFSPLGLILRLSHPYYCIARRGEIIPEWILFLFRFSSK